MVFVTRALNNVRNMTRLNVVDNSAIGEQAKKAGKQVKIIDIYNKTRHRKGGVGDKVMVTLMGQMRKGIIVGTVANQRPMLPKFDKNNVVLIDNNNVPLGTRVTCPLPNILRKQGATTARLMAIGTKFI